MRLRVLFALVLFSTVAFAHDSEPINTNFAAPFARRAGNLQFRFQYFRLRETYDFADTEFEYGFAPRQQVSIGFPMTRLDGPGVTHIRPGNLELGYRLLIAGENRRRYALSINPFLELPTGDKRVSERSFAAGGTLNLDTHPLPKVWTHTNLGYETPIARIEEVREKLLIYNFAAMYEASEAVRPVLEIVGRHDLTSKRTDVYVVPEVILAPNHHWEIKAGLPIGATSSASSVGVQLQLTWKFGSRGRQ